jgi:hypothetical protein
MAPQYFPFPQMVMAQPTMATVVAAPTVGTAAPTGPGGVYWQGYVNCPPAQAVSPCAPVQTVVPPCPPPCPPLAQAPFHPPAPDLNYLVDQLVLSLDNERIRRAELASAVGKLSDVVKKLDGHKP